MVHERLVLCLLKGLDIGLTFLYKLLFVAIPAGLELRHVVLLLLVEVLPFEIVVLEKGGALLGVPLVLEFFNLGLSFLGLYSND